LINTVGKGNYLGLQNEQPQHSPTAPAWVYICYSALYCRSLQNFVYILLFRLLRVLYAVR